MIINENMKLKTNVSIPHNIQHSDFLLNFVISKSSIRSSIVGGVDDIGIDVGHGIVAGGGVIPSISLPRSFVLLSLVDCGLH